MLNLSTIEAATPERFGELGDVVGHGPLMATAFMLKSQTSIRS